MSRERMPAKEGKKQPKFKNIKEKRAAKKAKKEGK